VSVWVNHLPPLHGGYGNTFRRRRWHRVSAWYDHPPPLQGGLETFFPAVTWGVGLGLPPTAPSGWVWKHFSAAAVTSGRRPGVHRLPHLHGGSGYFLRAAAKSVQNGMHLFLVTPSMTPSVYSGNSSLLAVVSGGGIFCVHCLELKF